MLSEKFATALDLFKTKSPTLIGVDIASTSIKLIELSQTGKGTFRLERYAIEPLPKDTVTDGNIANLDQVSDALKRGWKRLGSRNRNIAMALPAAMVITKKIIVPSGQKEEELELTVEAEANQYIPFALDEVNLDFQTLGPAPNNPEEVEVLIAASRKEKVEDRVAAAELALLKPVVMDVEAYAIHSAYELVVKQLPGGGDGQIVALVDVGASAMKVTIMKDDQQLYAREQAFGGSELTDEIMRAYGMGPEEAENLKRSGTPPDNYEAEILHPFIENLAQEVARALQFFFTSTPYNEVHHIVLAGGSVLVPGVTELVGQRTNVNTLLADPFAGMAISPRIRAKQLAADAPSLMVACGLALRKFDQ